MEVVPGFAVMPSILKEKRFALSAPAGSRGGILTLQAGGGPPANPAGGQGIPAARELV
ncbi:hypothetical protein Bwad005_31890 [Bilophila wadsworthia]